MKGTRWGPLKRISSVVERRDHNPYAVGSIPTSVTPLRKERPHWVTKRLKKPCAKLSHSSSFPLHPNESVIGLKSPAASSYLPPMPDPAGSLS